MELNIDREGNKPLHEQIFQGIKKLILSGSMAGGYRLPSTRELAEHYSVSRNVVIIAYEQLLAEGFISSHTGKGSYVTEGLVYNEAKLPPLPALNNPGFKDLNKAIIDFRSGLPALSSFPLKQWLKVYRDTLLKAPPESFAYGDPQGTRELREAIARYTEVYRGVCCSPDQIIITGGTTQAISLLCRILMTENPHVFLEDPITKDLQEIIKEEGGILHGFPVDDQGITLQNMDNEPYPSFIYVTPSHQYPLGVTMSVKRRLELIKLAEKMGSYIVEDDYDSEFRYDVMPTPSLQGLAPNRVIYIGTFSKTLSPALRTGYLILPAELINSGRRRKWNADLHNPIPDQLVLAEFITQGYYTRSLARMKKRYKTRRDHMVRLLNTLFGPSITIMGSSVGLHMVVRFKGVVCDDFLLHKIEEAGVRVYPVEEHTMEKGSYSDSLILGFGNLVQEDAERGLRILKKVLTESL